MSASGTEPPEKVAANVQAEARFGLAFFRKHGWTLALLFVGVLLPLWGFSELAEDVHAQERFLFDDPTLLWLHARNGPHLDHFFVLMSMLGYGWGVIPADIAIVLWTAWRRRLREGLFFGVAVIGSALLNLGFKQLFSRHRPDLWASIAPEDTFSFPSGHAMGSMTLALAVIVLCWPTRWRWLVLLIALTFALLVAVSRIYLGVHYPSDILAGWSAACAWVLGVYLLVFRLRGNAAN